MTLRPKRVQPILKKSKVGKSSPERTCIGCRTRRSAADLVRFGIEEGRLKLGRDVSGRGAWLCGDTAVECFHVARKRNAVGRALAQDVADAQLDGLTDALSAANDSG